MAETLTELVARISTDATELKQGLSEGEKATEASSKKMADSLKKVGVAMAASGAAITAALGLMGKAAIDEEINIKRLGVALKGVGINYDDVKDSLEAVISATQRKTGIADDAQRDVLGRLILVTKDYKKALDLLPLTLDLAAAGQMDATTAATYLSKAYEDLEGGAEEISIRLGQATVQFKDLNEIQKLVGGTAEATANPFNVLKASIGDLAEAIGANLIPIITGAVDKIVDIAIRIQEWIKENPLLAKQLTLLSLAVGLVATEIGGVILVLPQLIAGFKALTIVIDIATVSMWGFYASLVVIPLAAAGAAIAISELTGNTQRMNEMGQILWYQNIGNWILNQLGLTKAMETTTGASSTLYEELHKLGFEGEELTNIFETLSKAGYLSIGEATIEEVKEYVSRIEGLNKVVAEVVKTSEAFNISLQGSKIPLATATQKIGEITYRTQLFTQAEIDAAKAAGAKIEMIEQQSDVMLKDAEATKRAKDGLDDYTNSVKTATTTVGNLSNAITGTTYPSGGGGGGGEGGGGGRDYGAEREDWLNQIINIEKEVYEEAFPGLRFGLTRKELMALGYSEEYITRVIRDWLDSLPIKEMASGGIIKKPTLALLGEGGPEAVIPLGEAGGITINFTQPVFFDREDTMNRFVDMIRKGIQRQDRLRFGGAFNG